MKKEYMLPSITVVIIKTAHSMMLSGSFVKEGNAGSGENLSRRGGSSWDDDEE